MFDIYLNISNINSMKRIVYYDSKSKVLCGLLKNKMIQDFNNVEIIILKSFVEVVGFLENNEPLLFILDIFDNDYNEIDLIDSLIDAHHNLSILIFTSLKDDFLEFRHLNKDKRIFYLNKNCSYKTFKSSVLEILKEYGYKQRIISSKKRHKLDAINVSKSSILDTLSFRERQMASLILKGISQVEIGQMLNIAPTTINTYKTRIIKKTGNINLIDFINNYGKFFK